MKKSRGVSSAILSNFKLKQKSQEVSPAFLSTFGLKLKKKSQGVSPAFL